jgi:hypothetical protein
MCAILYTIILHKNYMRVPRFKLFVNPFVPPIKFLSILKHESSAIKTKEDNMFFLSIE